MMIQRRKKKVGGTLVSLGCVFLLLLVLKNSELAINHVREGIKLSLERVIPSLFPFMIISELMVKSGVADVLSKPLTRLARFVFGVSRKGATVFLIGALCGFPLGARSAIQLYDDGEIDREELSSLMDFSNNPSSAFVVSAVGISLFGSRSIGVLLYVITLASAVSVGVIRNLFQKKGKRRKITEASQSKIKGLRLVDFTEAVTGGALGVINVCAFVIFFCVVSGALGAMLDSLCAPYLVKALLFCIVEMTGGAASAVGLGGGIAVILVAFCLGWSGLSVHCQVLSLCEERISALRYVVSKFIQGMLNAVYTWGFLALFGDSILESSGSVTTVRFEIFESARFITLFLFAVSVMLCLVKKKIPRKERGIGI